MDFNQIFFSVQIVEHLQGYDKHLHSYLDALLTNNYEASKKYHGLLVGLYADYSPDRLMSFLRSSGTVNVRKLDFLNPDFLVCVCVCVDFSIKLPAI